MAWNMTISLHLLRCELQKRLNWAALSLMLRQKFSIRMRLQLRLQKKSMSQGLHMAVKILLSKYREMHLICVMRFVETQTRCDII